MATYRPLYDRYRAIKLRQDERADKSVGKFIRRMIRKRVCVLEIAATAKLLIMANLLTPIEEIGYFTFTNNITMSFH